MRRDETEIAKYACVDGAEGRRYRFFCGASGAAVYTTAPLPAGLREDMAYAAWEREGKRHFNRCRRCGRWVGDLMFNVDVSECVDCSPWEDAPRFCPKCGEGVAISGPFCCSCGSWLRYGGNGSVR